MAIRVAEKLGLSTDELDTNERYEEALRDKQFVVAVLAPSAERKEQASRMLNDNGGRFINYLGRFTIESLHR